jgi:chitinase
MGFDIGWDQARTPPWADLTQVALFALETTNGPGLDTHFLTTVNVPGWTAAAHAHGVTAFITIGGISDQNWENACNNTNRAQFVQNLVSYAVNNHFDGIDLDIEDNAWAAMTAPVAPWDTCVQAIATAAHAAGLVVSEDVTTPWMGIDVAPTQSYVEQFNLMTYGDTCANGCSSFGSDVRAMVSQGLTGTSKFVLGIDDIDGPEPDCAAVAGYAKAQGLAGVMIWDINTDQAVNGGTYGCFNAAAGG